MTNIDCGKDGYKTPKEIKYEQKLEKIEKLCQQHISAKKIIMAWEVLQIIESEV